MKDIPEVNPPQAWDMLQSDDGAVLIDVRTSMEYHYVGHPVGAIHVPWVEPPGWQPDPQFLQKVNAALLAAGHEEQKIHDKPLLLICRSGSRSAMAASVLAQSGFNKVYNVTEGFEGDRDENLHRGNISGWRFHSLPWQQD